MAPFDDPRSGLDGVRGDPAPRPAVSGDMLAIFDASQMPTAVTRVADGVILFANPACLELLGWPEDEFVGRSIVEVGSWGRREDRTAIREQLAAEGAVRNLEAEITTRSGETRTVLTSISHVDVDGEPCLIGHVHDISERLRLEAKLRESEDRFRQVTETIQQGFLLRELDPPEVLYVSPAVGRIFGIDLATLYDDPLALQKLVHPDDRDAVLAPWDATAEAADFECRILRPDGETRWVWTRAEPVRVEEGRVTRIAAVSEDVTAERELRDALRQNEARFRLLAEHSTDVIGRLSPDQRIEYVSPASRSVYGYEPEEMVGRFGWEFIHPDDLAEMREDFTARADQPAVITNTYRVRRGDGSYVWVEAKISAVHDPVSGEFVEFHTVARDVGERRRAEAAIRRARDEAELANAAKSEFLSRMSHELRTPLHAILGFGELLERDDLGARQGEHLAQIMRGGHHLLELINEVLDLSRIERGELRLSLEPVPVGPLVRETLEMLAPLAAARSVALSVVGLGDDDLHVRADLQRLKQVLLNLLSNAVKYNREGGEVRVRARSDTVAVARIEVADDGPGIADDDLARVFAAFERLGAEVTDVEGTGLGLALTKRLVDAMDGTIGVVSVLGSGSTFWLELPLAGAPAAKPLQAPVAPVAADAPARRRDARSVLYVEDNTSNVKLVEVILRERPEVTLLVAQQGSLGLELAVEHLPALVLLDLNPPDMTGEEILRRLRGDSRTAALQIVVVSADATPGQAARLSSAGADGYLTKPFELERFLDVVDGLAAPPQSAPGRPAGTALDASFLDTLRSLHPDDGAVEELVDDFLRDSATRLEALRSAAAAADAECVRSAAHAWRGACSMTGGKRLAALLEDIEMQAQAGRVPGTGALAGVEDADRNLRAALAERFG